MPEPEPPGRPLPESGAAEPSIEGAFAADGADLTVIRWMLSLTPAQRLAAAQDLIDTAWTLREGRDADP